MNKGVATLKILRATQSGRKISVTEPFLAPCLSTSVVNGHLPLLSSSNRPFSKIEMIASNTRILKMAFMQAKSRYPRQRTCHQNISECMNLIKNSLFGITKIIQYQVTAMTIFFKEAHIRTRYIWVKAVSPNINNTPIIIAKAIFQAT